MFADRYKAKVMPIYAMEGWVEDWAFPQVIYTYYRGNDLATARNSFEKLGKWVDSCEVGWKRTDAEIPESDWETTKGSSIRFSEGVGGERRRGILIQVTRSSLGYTVRMVLANAGLS